MDSDRQSRPGAVRIGARRMLPIPVTTLRPDSFPPIDLHQAQSDGDPILYRQRDHPVTAEDIDRLTERGVRTLFVEADQHVEYQRYMRRNLTSFMNDEKIAPIDRYRILNETASDVLKTVFRSGETDQIIHEAKELGGQIVDLVANRDLVAYDLFLVLHHDYRIFAHSINVATYCMLLGQESGIADTDELKALVVGGLLHDVGKLSVSAAVLAREARPSPSDAEEIRRHPVEGFVQLCHRPDLQWGQLMMIYQHHERADGKGYPVGVSGAEIHPWARLCAAVNVFDRLTCERAGLKALSAREALDRLDRQADARFDQEMVKCWKAALRPSD